MSRDERSRTLVRCLAIGGPIFATVILLGAIVRSAHDSEGCRPFVYLGTAGDVTEAFNGRR